MMSAKTEGKAMKKLPDKKQKPAKAKKQRKSIAVFFRDMYAELKKVTWPTRQELITSTIVVIVIVVAVGLIIGAFDWGLSAAFKALFV